MLISTLNLANSYTLDDIATRMAASGGAWVVVDDTTDDQGHRYAAVICADGSCGWWTYASLNNTLMPWEEAVDDGYLTFDTLPDALKAFHQAPQSMALREMDDPVLLTWLKEDWRLPEICVSHILSDNQEVDWEKDSLLAMQAILTDVAAAIVRGPFSLTLYGDNSPGRHSSQEREEQKMLSYFEKVRMDSWPGQKAHYAGTPYAEIFTQAIDIKDERLHLFVDLSQFIMKEYRGDMQGWSRDYNDGAYEGASGYTAYQQTLELNIDTSAHMMMDSITRGLAYLETLDVDAARVLLNTLRHDTMETIDD